MSETEHRVGVTYTNYDDGIHLVCACGWTECLGFGDADVGLGLDAIAAARDRHLAVAAQLAAWEASTAARPRHLAVLGAVDGNVHREPVPVVECRTCLALMLETSYADHVCGGRSRP